MFPSLPSRDRDGKCYGKLLSKSRGRQDERKGARVAKMLGQWEGNGNLQDDGDKGVSTSYGVAAGEMLSKARGCCQS